jgi:hypothetical protein
MTGMKRNLKEILEIAQSTSDPKTKLQARAIAVLCIVLCKRTYKHYDLYFV